MMPLRRRMSELTRPRVAKPSSSLLWRRVPIGFFETTTNEFLASCSHVDTKYLIYCMLHYTILLIAYHFCLCSGMLSNDTQISLYTILLIAYHFRSCSGMLSNPKQFLFMPTHFIGKVVFSYFIVNH